MKATTALSGPYDDVLLPPGAEQLDYEVELAVVIGRRTRRVRERDALDHVAGFTLMNDYSERSYQRDRGGQWTKGKSADTFAPLGPLLLTSEAVDAGNVELWLTVNGETRQRASTSQLIFPVPHLVSYVSQFMTLLPGDVISTGTPEGVGAARNPPSFLVPGDRVEYGGDGLGQAAQRIAPAPP
jgi:2-keto-4-pentenoate hydratase/2-oxohepta-3-ene-1,7-dioic acid hydratase in catechol pathway